MKSVLIIFGFLSSLVMAFQSEVEVCYSPTTFGNSAPLIGDGLDFLAGTMRAKHTWIRTPNKELGMGLRSGTLAWTEWVDHQGFGERRQSRCYSVENCNLDCVEDLLVEGSSLGLYSLVNTCQIPVIKVLRRCGCKDTCVKRSSNWPYRCLQWTWPSVGGGVLRKIKVNPS